MNSLYLSGFLIGFLYLLNNIYNNHSYYFIFISRYIGYFFIYKKKFINKIKNTNTKKFYIDKIEINNGNKFICSNYNQNYQLDYLVNNERLYNSIEIYYTINSKQFFIIYSKENKLSNIGFDNIYSLSLIQVNNAFSCNSDNIILLELINSKINYNDIIKEQILNIIKELSGPNGDFYKEHNYKLNKNLLVNIINKKIQIDLEHDINFSILYSNGDTLIL